MNRLCLVAFLRPRRAGIAAVLALALVSLGCDVPGPWSSASARYAFAHDAQGRLVRLNKITGEMTLVEIATTPPARRARPAAPATPVERATPSPAPEVAADEATAVAAVEPDPIRPITCIDPAVLSESGLARVQSDSPVYVSPRAIREPLTTVTTSTVLPVLDIAGDWVQIQFDDMRWGPRVGYIHCSRLGLASSTELAASASTRAVTPPGR